MIYPDLAIFAIFESRGQGKTSVLAVLGGPHDQDTVFRKDVRKGLVLVESHAIFSSLD